MEYHALTMTNAMLAEATHAVAARLRDGPSEDLKRAFLRMLAACLEHGAGRTYLVKEWQIKMRDDPAWEEIEVDVKIHAERFRD